MQMLRLVVDSADRVPRRAIGAIRRSSVVVLQAMLELVRSRGVPGLGQ